MRKRLERRVTEQVRKDLKQSRMTEQVEAEQNCRTDKGREELQNS
jgi:hypothetical protein